MSKKTWYCCL